MTVGRRKVVGRIQRRSRYVFEGLVSTYLTYNRPRKRKPLQKLPNGHDKKPRRLPPITRLRPTRRLLKRQRLRKQRLRAIWTTGRSRPRKAKTISRRAGMPIPTRRERRQRRRKLQLQMAKQMLSHYPSEKVRPRNLNLSPSPKNHQKTKRPLPPRLLLLNGRRRQMRERRRHTRRLWPLDRKTICVLLFVVFLAT